MKTHKTKTEKQIADDVCNEIRNIFITYGESMKMQYDFDYANEKTRELYDEIDKQTGKQIDVQA